MQLAILIPRHSPQGPVNPRKNGATVHDYSGLLNLEVWREMISAFKKTLDVLTEVLRYFCLTLFITLHAG